MELNLKIEPITEKDLPAVAEIEQVSFKDPWPIEAFETELERNEFAIYLVARVEEELIAYIGGWLIVNEAHITTLAVQDKYRRCSIATRLVEELIKQSIKGGARLITLEVRPSNMAARSLYEKLGFSVRGMRTRYYPDEDALIMTRDFDNLPEKPRGGPG